MPTSWVRFKTLLLNPVSGASLAVFRIAVGCVMALEAFSLLRPSNSTSGRVMLETYYTGADVTFNFPYAWFSWLPFLSPSWMYALVVVMGIAALMLAAGLFYRVSAALVFLAWGYLYAVESTRTYWMSYYYLELLVTFLLIWMPAAQTLSLDSLLFRKEAGSDRIPFWPILLLRAQLVIAYFYAGFAKLNADWLLDAMPVRQFLARSPFFARFGPNLSEQQLQLAKSAFASDGLAYFLSYAGAFFDLLIGPLLLFRRTRILGLILLLLFHGFNHFVLFDDLVWFPLLGILTATIFLDPDWPEKLRNRFAKSPSQRSQRAPLATFTATRVLPVFVVLWIATQALLPLRHYLIPGDGRFTWEGLSFSWRLKTEWYAATPVEISLSDSGIISRGNGGQTTINWGNWAGERAIYRKVDDVRNLPWERLPELVVLLEPETGERVLFNPLAKGITSEEAARTRLAQLWQELYQRAPPTVHRTISVNDLVAGFATAVQSKGGNLSQNQSDNIQLFVSRYGVSGSGQGMPLLRRLHPFALRSGVVPAAPFLLVEDNAILQETRSHWRTVNRNAWKGETLVVLLAEIGPETRKLLPKVCFLDAVGNTDTRISWDILRDVSVSKGMHISTNPFLLQRYAVRVADAWQKEYGRRPAVYARSGLSLNGRAPLPLVDSTVDLAQVNVRHWWHNAWIKDLPSDQKRLRLRSDAN